MKSFFAAVQFLTVIPLPRAFVGDVEDLGKSVPFFPIVGLLIGMMAAILGYIMAGVLPPFPACAIVVIFLIAVSGGLHMDGLADTADGFFSARPRERILEIMKDSRIGVMGVIAVVCVIMLKFSLLVSLPLSSCLSIIPLMPLAGRCALVIMMTVLPYVRSEGGLATPFMKSRSWIHVLWAALFLIISGVLTAQWVGLVASLVTLAITALCALYSFQKIGGYTGDTLGAVCEIAEIIPVLVAVAWGHDQYYL
jgi:adenosylcobinamide-GDP ribazoletransferase